jgi:hypothetical protein
VSDQAELLAADLPQPPEAESQGEFYPVIENTGSLPAYQRPEAYVPILLETTGVTSHQRQLDLISKTLILKESIVAKLRSIGANDLAQPIADCHTAQSFAQCQGCRKVRMFWNRCENFYCPTCQPVLAHEREESLRWWTYQVAQPKHVVVTVRNTAVITWNYVKWLKQCLTKLRRRKFASNWRGGLWRIECTNEGKGWHLHIHLLVDANWIDPSELAKTWANIVGQDFAIVWVRDARNRDYLKEVTKYVVKGTTLAAWTPADIAHFINAFTGHRLFGVFGTLYGKRTQWKDWIDSLATSKRHCDCGCDQWRVYSESEWLWKLETEGPVFPTKPNAPPTQQPAFDL